MIFQTPLEILFIVPQLMLIGIITTIFVGINLFLGFSMLYQGIKTKNSTIIYIGAIFFVGVEAWGGVVFNFIVVLIFNVIPPWQLYFLVHGGFLFILNFIWLLGVTELANIEGKKRAILMVVIGIFFAILEIIYITIIFTDYTLLGVPVILGELGEAPIQVDYTLYSFLFLMINLSTFTIVISWFVKGTFKADDKRLRIKSRFLLVYVIGVTGGGLFEIFVPGLEVSIIVKVILTFSMVMGYFGFLLPPRIEQIFVKS